MFSTSMTFKERYVHRWMHHHIPLLKISLVVLPSKTLVFCVRGLYDHLHQERRGMVLVKGNEQQRLIESHGLPAVSLENLPKYKELCSDKAYLPIITKTSTEKETSASAVL
ncbi:hypothetical protein TNCT_437431 [Trichonephila clavata]|uniref:Uncharacterized protein n=1 Tax=Trichonephila clavata TaxID=2740835 RepID=A0A8X6F0U8_TRICU|nr:hypothetical protein TNCT_437431 [Trichonephila clavata]